MIQGWIGKNNLPKYIKYTGIYQYDQGHRCNCRIACKKDTELVNGTRMSLLLFSGLTLFKHSWDSKNFCWASFSWFNDDVNKSISYNNAIKEVNSLRGQSSTNTEIDTYFFYHK